MASTIRAQRLMNAKTEIDKSKTLISKIAALRELLAVPDVGRIYQRYAQKKIVECRAEAVAAANDELLRRLDLLQERLVSHVESEKARLERKHKRESGGGLETSRKPAAKTSPVFAEPKEDLMDLWKTMLEEKT
jgi:hypothetical protein